MIKASYDKHENIIYSDWIGEITLEDILSNIDSIDLHFGNLQHILL